MTIKTWFINKEFTQGERYAISTARRVIAQKETDKAVLLKWLTDDLGNISRWVPKSCIENLDSIREREVEENTESYAIGTEVIHGAFGAGKIVDMTPEVIKIDFEKVGTKTIFAAMANKFLKIA